jgi:metal-sulfur cluster biosynthetic enzyme
MSAATPTGERSFVDGAGIDEPTEPADHRLEVSDVLAMLDRILDPCVSSAGTRGSIVEMGLVRDVRIEEDSDGAHVHLAIAVTEPTCIMFHSFARDAHLVLGRHPGVASVHCELAEYRPWTELDMSSALQSRLAHARHARNIKVTTTGVAPSAPGEPVRLINRIGAPQ